MSQIAKPAHTPGPWAVAEESFDNGGFTELVIRGNDPRATVAVALDFGKNNPGWQIANARLIAAAPEMLEALKEVTKVLSLAKSLSFDEEVALGMALEAVAKAEGRRG